MQTLKFDYTTDSVSHFTLELYSDGERMTRQDLSLMGDYIYLLFITIKRLGNTNSGIDFDGMLHNLMRDDDE